MCGILKPSMHRVCALQTEVRMGRVPAHRERPAAGHATGELAIPWLGLLSIAIGAWTGLAVALFRLGLEGANRLRDLFLTASHRWPVAGFVAVICVFAAVVSLAAWLARRFSPYTEGSGIPEVEAALERRLPSAPLPRLLLVKFVGGLLALGGGMALGPEGPSVQIGAVGARVIGRRFDLRWSDLHSLIAAGAGAGLAVAFNAPIAGVVFVLEELHRRFVRREAVAALGASVTAILVAQLLLGDAPLYHIVAAGPKATSTSLGPAIWPLYLVLGLLAGLAAVAYNWALLAALDWAERLDRLPLRPQAAVLGALVGVIGWFAPDYLGTGDVLIRGILTGAVVVASVPLVFALRFLLGAASYGVRAPGGLFAPLLLLGAQFGLLFGTVCHWAFPGMGVSLQAFAVVGMAAFFAGIIRAPITGLVLVVEMTASFPSLLPALVAIFGAMVAAAMTRVPPLYDTLRNRLVERVKT